MNYYIQIKSPNKAKNDIDLLFKDMGYVNLTPNKKSDNAVSRFLLRLIAVAKIVFVLHNVRGLDDEAVNLITCSKNRAIAI